MAYNPPAVQSAVIRSLNTWFKVNDYRMAICHYSVTIQTSSTLIAGSGGRIYFETSTDGVNADVLLDSGEQRLLPGLVNPGTTGTIKLSGTVPLAKWARLRTFTLEGTPSYFSVTSTTGSTTTNAGYGTETQIG